MSSRVPSLARAVVTVGGLTMVSRLLGFIRDILMAAVLGAGPVADAFFIAFKLPNFFRRLFAEGAFNAAFVPLFSETLKTGGPAAARLFAEQVLSVLLLVLLVLTAVVEIAMPAVMLGLAPGFDPDGPRYALAVTMTRMTFPYLLFISLVSLHAGVLNALGRFAAAAATPVLLNLCLIATLLLFATPGEGAGLALAAAVAAAGMVQLVWLVVACRRAGMVLYLRLPAMTAAVRRLLVLMGPAAIGAGVAQINLVIDIVLASLLPAGSVSFLYYADRLNQLPIGVVGVAIGTALLPGLSRLLAGGEDKAARAMQNRAIEGGLLLALPAAVALIAIPGPLIATLFQRGAFAAADAQATAGALAAYAAGLPAYILVKVLTPAYYARKDTKTPMLIAAFSLVVNLGLNLLLMGPLLHVGLALATALASWVNSLLLAGVLMRRGLWRPDRRLLVRVGRIVLSSALMGAILYFLSAYLSPWLADGPVHRAAALALLVAAGLSVYGMAAHFSGAARLGELRALLRGRDG